MIEIKKLPPEKWQEYQKLRLDALLNDPIAFGSSYEEEISRPKYSGETVSGTCCSR